jgi:predicted MFS family arabinose efflux permease
MGGGGAVGGLSVWTVAYAEQQPLPGGAGTLMACYAAGGFAGGVWHGTRAHTGTPVAGVAVLAWVLAVLAAPVALAPGPGAEALLCALSGLGLAPLLAVAFAVVERVAAPGTITEAFAWIVAAFQTGVALGAGAIGVALEAVPLRTAALLLPAMAALGAVVLTAGKGRLRR